MLSECAGVRRRGRVLETWVASPLAPRSPPRLLGMGKQTFYLITALPPPRPPPHGPLPAQPLAQQTQCAPAAKRAPVTLRECLAQGAAPTRLPEGSGSFASLRIPLSNGTLLARGLEQGAVG